MSFRVESFVCTPNILLLPFALAFFALLSFQHLHPSILDSRWRARFAVLTAMVVGGLGGWLYGLIGTYREIEDVALHYSAFQLRFGSFGGYWGAILGMGLFAAVSRVSVLRCLDAIVPGLLVGGAVARVGCLFTGCCVGIRMERFGSSWFQPLMPVAFYDIVALLGTWLIVRRMRGGVPGCCIATYCIAYGAFRGAIELLREQERIASVVTYGHVMVAIQVCVGIVFLYAAHSGAQKKNATTEVVARSRGKT